MESKDALNDIKQYLNDITDDFDTIERDLNVLNIIHTKCVSMSNNLYKIWNFNDYNEYYNYFDNHGLIFEKELTESEFNLIKEWINHAI